MVWTVGHLMMVSRVDSRQIRSVGRLNVVSVIHGRYVPDDNGHPGRPSGRDGLVLHFLNGAVEFRFERLACQFLCLTRAYLLEIVEHHHPTQMLGYIVQQR